MGIQIRGIVGLIAVAGALIGMSAVSSDVFAARTSSTSYIIDASVNDTFGGAQGSGSYKLISSGGESIIGDGSSGSYKLSAGYIAQLTEEESANFIEVGVQPSGLVAYYPLNEVNGTTVNDQGPNEHNGATENDPSWEPSGKISGAIDLDDTQSQRINVPDSDQFTGSALTISMWANQTALQTDAALISHWQYSSQGSWALQTSGTDNTQLRFLTATSLSDSGTTYVDSVSGAWSANTWRHIAVTYDGSQTSNNDKVRLYVDGVDVTAASPVGTIPATLINPNAP
ncbi:hypothetical protein B7Z17_04065, partial [Candidatus Saccharibacteria bacterium 32-49-10]